MLHITRSIDNVYFKHACIISFIAIIYTLIFVFFVLCDEYIVVGDAVLYSLQIVSTHLFFYISIICLFCGIWFEQVQDNYILVGLRKINLISIALIIVSPFFGSPIPITNSYVSIIDNLSFITGISIFSSSIVIHIAYFLWVEFILIWQHKNIFYSNKLPSLLIALNMYLVFIISYVQLRGYVGNTRMHLSSYYNRLFYSSVHVMYLLYFILMIMLLGKIVALVQNTPSDRKVASTSNNNVQERQQRYFAFCLYLVSMSSFYVYILLMF